jgi:two-component system OmpR family sensor kinase
MRRRWSIAFRLALWLSIGTTLFWLGAAAISAVVLRTELEQAFDETLRQSAFRLLPLARRDAANVPGRPEAVPRISRGPGGGPDIRRGPPPPAPGQPPVGEESFTYVVYDPAGTVVLRAEDAPETLPALPATDGFVTIEGHRAYASSDLRSGYRILVLETTDARGQALWDAIAGLLWPLAALIPLVAAGIWLAVRLALRPVERLSRDVALRNSANLAPLDDTGQPAELAPIAHEIAGLLGRLRAAMEAERAFAASSAHELRTPIAGALAQTQRLGLELGDHPAAPRVKGVEQALRNLSELAEKLLQLSRLEAGFARSDRLVDLQPVLELVIRDFEVRQSTAQRVELTIDAAARLRCAINPDAFAIAVRNLVNNALLHGAGDSRVEVEAGPGATIRVRNHGPVLAPEVLAGLRQRFARGPTRASGTGLGLAVVDAIMEQTGGRLLLKSPAPGWTDGFEATLELGPRTSNKEE